MLRSRHRYSFDHRFGASVPSWLGPGLLVAAFACGDDAASGSPTAGSGGRSGGAGAPAGGAGAPAGGAGAPAGSGGDTAAAGSGAHVIDAGPSSGECDVTVVASPPASALHQQLCSDVSYDTNPPSGGDHYAIWPAYQTYDFPLPTGVLVHALEHGAIVFWYNCPEGCPDEVAEVESFIAAEPTDPLCAGTPAARRAVLVPYPELGSRWAASSWGYALTADCFDPTAFGAFYTEHYGRGREALCNSGTAYTENPCP
jgi:uncharacterized protein DUF3105